MTSQPVEANVVLTTDNTQYDQAMMASAGSTDNLGRSVDSLGAKIGKLNKTAGRTLIGITMADVGVITAATGAWARYENQMSQLYAQAAVLSKTQEQQTRVTQDYSKAVKTLRTEYGATITESTKLVQTLSKVTNIRQTRDLANLSKVFEDMSKATGESSEGLASSLTNLQKVMGTPINSDRSRKYADQFTYLAAQTQASATQLIDFTSQLAPLGKAMGLSQTQITGFAAGFTKAGAGGVAAANVFSKVAYDISKSMATGSPEIAHYANLIGVTNERFKKMDGAEQILRIFEALQAMGPRAATELDRMGLDGTRSLRQIQAVLNQPGGLREMLGEAQKGYISDAAAKGRASAMRGMADDFQKISQNIQITAEAFGQDLAPVMEKFTSGMVKLSGVAREVVEGPFGQFAAVVAGVGGVLTGGVGSLMLFAGALMKVAAAFTLFRSSAAYGIREGFRGGGSIMRTDEGYGPAGGPLLTRGRQLAESPRTSWFMRGQYNVGQFVGSGAGTVAEAMRGGWITGRQWADPNYQPARGGMLGYAAGGAGRVLQNFVNPVFDQMRYADPTKRRIWLGNEFPMARARDIMATSKTMGEVGLAQSQLKSIRLEELATKKTPWLTEEERSAKLENLRQLREETKTRLNSFQYQELGLKKNIAAMAEHTAAAQNGATRWNRFAQATFTRRDSYLAGATGAVMGAGRAGVDWLRQRPQYYGPMLGTLGLAAAGPLGINSNAWNMGMVGAMFGSGPATVGFAGVGAFMDAQAQTRRFNQIRDARRAALRAGEPASILMANQAAITEFQPYQEQEQSSRWERLTHPGRMFGNIGRGIGSAFQWVTGGGDAYTTRQQEAQAAQKQTQQMVGALSSIAQLQGKPLGRVDPRTERGMQELNGVISSITPTMDKLGISTKDILKTWSERGTKEGAEAWTKLMRNLVSPDQALGYYREARGTASGRAMLESELGQQALLKQGNIPLAYKAVQDIFGTMRTQGMSYLGILHSATQAQADIGDENSRTYELQSSIAAKAQEALHAQMPMMTRPQAFAAQIGEFQAVSAVVPQTPSQVQNLENEKQATIAAMQDQRNYFAQLLLMQDQYNLSRQRAEQDYSLQRQYSLHDYNLSRERSEEAFNRSRRREVRDYHISVSRAWYEFHLQRSRQQDDFQHQVQLQAKQMASSAYDVYQRAPTQRTAGASWLLSNASDILQRLRDQRKNLNRLRALGFSDAVIQQLQFSDPNNAQQLARFVAEVEQDRSLVGQYNRVARQTVRAARALVTDPSNPDWKESLHQFRLGRERSREDMNRSMAQGRDDFMRGLSRQRKDYNIMMDQQAEDFHTQMQRMEHAYQVQMSRAAEDIALVGKEISGNLMQVLNRSADQLTGHAQRQARQALRAIKDLRTNVNPEAVAMMTELAAIFGFEFKLPKGYAEWRNLHNPPHSQDPQDGPRHSGVQWGAAQGGVVPGWTPGRDTTTVKVSGGEAIMRPEWTRAVGEKNVEAMNHQARHGGFFLGGVMPLTNATYVQHTSGYPWARWAGDLNYPGYADYGKPILAWRSGVARPFDYHADRSYGRGQVIESGNQSSLYAHMSKVITALAGRRVQAGQVIGYVGDYGNTGTPPSSHLHFEIRGGRIELSDDVTAGPQVKPARWRDVRKDYYLKAEDAAARMKGVHPLKPGDISEVINRYARRAWNRLSRQYGSPSKVTPLGEATPPAPEDVHGNQALVRKAMLEAGWNQWSPLYQLVMHESGFNNTAQNPTSTAYGMFQFLDSTWAGVHGKKTSDPWLQSVYGMRYIKDRYKDPEGAWNFWQGHHWYKDGSVFTGPQTIGVGEKGPEAVIPLNDRGAAFLTDVMGSVMGGRQVMQAGRTTNVYATRVDHSTNFTGPITVQANDPNELILKLQARQRVMALSRPTMTGSAA